MQKTKTLIMVRHAKSAQDVGFLSDFERPLNERGLNDAPIMAARCKKNIPVIDAMISSPAKRARTTAELFSTTYKKNTAEIIFVDRLYHASSETISDVVKKIKDEFDVVAIFCHNPGITDFVNVLDVSVKIDNMPTCGVFAIQANTDSWKHFFSSPQKCLFVDYPKKS